MKPNTELFMQLKARHRQERVGFSDSLSLRVHRSLSWLLRSLEHHDDLDLQFITLWISFNAAYASEIPKAYRKDEQGLFRDFFVKLCYMDQTEALSHMVWQQFPHAIRVLLANPYVFRPFWQYQNGALSEAEWKASLTRSTHAVNKALGEGRTVDVLGMVFERIYTLRNQIIHGGATWNSQANRDQVRDCCSILNALVPVMLTLMMDHPDALWGDACYPVVSAG